MKDKKKKKSLNHYSGPGYTEEQFRKFSNQFVSAASGGQIKQ